VPAIVGKASGTRPTDLRHPEVEQLQGARLSGLAREHDVVGLHVAVDDTGFVDRPERREKLPNVANGFQNGDRPALPQLILQRAALQTLENEIRAPVRRGAEREAAHDVGVGEREERLCLDAHAIDHVHLGQERAMQQLDDDPLAGVEPLGFIDLSHASAAETGHRSVRRATKEVAHRELRALVLGQKVFAGDIQRDSVLPHPFEARMVVVRSHGPLPISRLRRGCHEGARIHRPRAAAGFRENDL
jgi:hypothetical protein